MKILVCGGRDFIDFKYLEATLDKICARFPTCTIIHGGARGADSFAGLWASLPRNKGRIFCKAYPADWEKYGKSAGIKRNHIMLQEEKPNLVIAFKGGKGTNHMVSISILNKIKVLDLRNA